MKHRLKSIIYLSMLNDELANHFLEKAESFLSLFAISPVRLENRFYLQERAWVAVGQICDDPFMSHERYRYFMRIVGNR